MTNIRTINPSTFGPALFPYSQATVAGGFVYIAGQVALDDDNNVVSPGDAYEQTKVTLDRISRVLAEVDGTLEDIVTATVFVPSLDHLPEFNRAWQEVFGDHRPARATVVAGLLIDGLVVEVQSTAVLRQTS
ncbi:RidA family protein [Microbacterium trichothecenolyticum]|uniref:RidA family protein n=1 Tax=Microbacterium ureisolvens TaxID=2781186 RepID=A0ABS7I2K5_9MICO|nr:MULTISPECIES: RidA family protein [Microbacterium]MBW9111894.1 RidA family protein [Microbacterium ureisolvens]MBW9122259.1 RidA family protein [Microbacterium trichothecenolyticum]